MATNGKEHDYSIENGWRRYQEEVLTGLPPMPSVLLPIIRGAFFLGAGWGVRAIMEAAAQDKRGFKRRTAEIINELKSYSQRKPNEK